MSWKEEYVQLGGPYTVVTLDKELKAKILDENGFIYKRFMGETAWSDAVREAGDLNVAHTMKESKRGESNA